MFNDMSHVSNLLPAIGGVVPTVLTSLAHTGTITPPTSSSTDTYLQLNIQLFYVYILIYYGINGENIITLLGFCGLIMFTTSHIKIIFARF